MRYTSAPVSRSGKGIIRGRESFLNPFPLNVLWVFHASMPEAVKRKPRLSSSP